MTSYVLKTAVPAVRYIHGTNEKEVSELLTAAGRTGHSFNNISGRLRIYNSGPDLNIEDGSWVVALAGDVAVLDDVHFTDLFEPA
jgi:hypothetical protein